MRRKASIKNSRSKYRNKKITVDGITFDSQKEYRHWCELLLLEEAGAITDLQRQVKYVLLPAQYETYERYGKRGKRLKDGKRCIEKSVVYIADFVYKDLEKNEIVVEDTKGFRTADYKLKRKMMLYFHNIKIKEV
ncbi:MAG: DUF1064 domain-containing protein [Oscillospiraceae bacterium]|nr:DUF1064 domain-containing protein [Oscillospiraceae bacterium]